MRVTGIGGGHGLAATLRAARLYASDVQAVVTVADDGGSSGRLSRELGIPPPGDIRNCLAALATDERLEILLQHRFEGGTLGGHALGNLVIAALAQMTGDFAAAVDEVGRLIGTQGRIHPATTALVGLGAEVAGGTIRGQVAVARSEAPIDAVYLEPEDPPAHGPAMAAIESADQVVMGPGSLFTSLIATLLVPGIAQALGRTQGTRIFVCNARVQHGETQGMSATEHVEALFAHAGPCADVVIVQSPHLDPDGIRLDQDHLAAMGPSIVEADVATRAGVHDPVRLAQVLGSLPGRRSSPALG